MTQGVGVVVVSRNTRDAALRCVVSVREQSAGLVAGIVVIDNDSSDGTCDALIAAGGCDVAPNGGNAGFAAACNAGAARFPDVEFLLFLNADVELAPGCLGSLVAALRSEPSAALAGPAFAFRDGRPQSSVRGDPTRAALLFQHTAARFLRIGAAAYRRYKAPPEAGALGVRSVPVTLGAAMLVRSDDFRAVSGFDAARYFLYFEEADLQRRLRERGRGVLSVPDARAVHEGGASADQDRDRALLWYMQSLFRYVDRFDGRAAGLLYRAVFKPLFILKLPCDAVRDTLALVFRGRREKAAELRLALRFGVLRIVSFLVA